MGKSWAAEVKVFGETRFTRNQIRFATEAEAKAAGGNLMCRWTQVDEYRATETDDQPTHRWDGKLAWPACQVALEPVVARAAE
jgi:hypothetical protein